MLVFAPGSFLSAVGLGLLFAAYALANKFAFLQLRKQINEVHAGFATGTYLSVIGMAARLSLLLCGIIMEQYSASLATLTLTLVGICTLLSALVWVDWRVFNKAA